MSALTEKTYKAKKSYFILLLFFTFFFIFLSCFTLNSLLTSDNSYPRQVIMIYFIGTICVWIILTCQVLTRFHSVRVGPDYLFIGNYRYYYHDVAISTMKKQLVKYKAAHLITIKQKYQYSFFIVASSPYQKQKRFHFQSKCYTDFAELYEILCQKMKHFQE